MLLLSVASIGILVGLAAVRGDPEITRVLEHADTAVAVVFLVDFVITFLRAPSKRRYFFTWGWLDLLSSIPLTPVLRLGRLGRILRLVRLAQSIKAIRIVSDTFLAHRGQSTVVAALLLTFLVVTTVGYGDRFPVTSEGRLVGGLLMFSGVGLFSTLAGLVASWLVTPPQPPGDGTSENRAST
ncbi:MAG: ion transporter [Gemmatimonadetes bacterium]|nr:ion transporter [Gemmatimonadota bacterium]